MRNLAPLLIFFLCLIISPVSVTAREVTDQIDVTITLPLKLTSVVSLAPAITEIVYALGRENLLSGVTRFSDYPEDAKKLYRVGTYIKPDLERIISLSPDVCLATKDGNPREAVEQLRAFGIPVFTINPQNIEEVIGALHLLGIALDAEPKATLLVEDIRRRLATVTSKTQGLPKKPSVFFQIDTEPIVSAGTDTFIHELISLAGGINLAAGPNPYPRYNWEQLLALSPEVVIITSMASEQTAENLQSRWQRWPEIPAVKNHRVKVVPANLFGRPTPRLIQGLEMLAAILHPEIFNPVGK